MQNIEKTISDLKEVAEYFFRLYRQAQDMTMITKQYDRFLALNNAINVFKDMKPVKPYDDGHGHLFCGRCGAEMNGNGHPLYCWHCGRAVEWDADGT